jgi:hypothetical protein
MRDEFAAVERVSGSVRVLCALEQTATKLPRQRLNISPNAIGQWGLFKSLSRNVKNSRIAHFDRAVTNEARLKKIQ